MKELLGMILEYGSLCRVTGFWEMINPHSQHKKDYEERASKQYKQIRSYIKELYGEHNDTPPHSGDGV